MTFAVREWLHALWLLPLLALGLWASASSRKRQVIRLFGEGLFARVYPVALTRRRAWRSTLVLLGIGLVCLAAAQPRWGFTWRELKSESREIVIALDVSQSMNAQDVEPSRFERARWEIRDFLEGLGGERVGLVVFAGGAYPRIPQTTDLAAIDRVVREIPAHMLRAQGSSLAAALEKSIDLMDEQGSGSSAIVILSDGEHWDEDIETQLDRLLDLEIRVYALGIGTPEGAPVPGVEGGFLKDERGELVVSRLAESSLESLAERTGGAYARSVAGGEDVEGLVAALRSDLQSVEEETRRERVWDERFQWPLAGAVAFFFLAGFLGEGVGVLLLFFLLSPTALADGSPDVSTVEGLWALGQSLYEEGRFEEAHETFSDLAQRAHDNETRLGARYNAGNAAYRAGRLEDALAEWDRVIEQDPENEFALANSQAVQSEIATRRQQEQEEQDGESEAQDGESEEQDGEQEESQGETGDAGDTGTADLGEIEEMEASPEEGEEPEEKPAASLGEGVMEMTPEEALRLLNAVEEGEPQVYVPSGSGGREW